MERNHASCAGKDMPASCPFCEASPADPCPLNEVVTLYGDAVTAGVPAFCDPDDGVCEACQ